MASWGARVSSCTVSSKRWQSVFRRYNGQGKEIRGFLDGDMAKQFKVEEGKENKYALVDIVLSNNTFWHPGCVSEEPEETEIQQPILRLSPCLPGPEHIHLIYSNSEIKRIPNLGTGS